MKERIRIRRPKAHPSEEHVEEQASPNRMRGDDRTNVSPSEATASPGERAAHGHDLSTFSLVPGQLAAGHALPAELQHKFGPALGMSLDHVRIHTGSPSAQIAESMNAHAVTVGSDI